MVAPSYSSCLYECHVMHHRLSPKRHRFDFSFFMFYLDLDELPSLEKSLGLFGTKPSRLYRFLESDYLPLGPQPLKEKVQTILHREGIQTPLHRVRLLTHTRVLGYIFNPVSFYYCFDPNNVAFAVIAEVGNTFGEKKLFVLPRSEHPDSEDGFCFRGNAVKHFYVSPFSDLNLQFDFRLGVPDTQFKIAIDDCNAHHHPVVISRFKGTRKPLTNSTLLKMTLKFPLMTTQVISQIHWHAFLLWLKGVPFFKKEASPELQQHVLLPHPALARYYSQQSQGASHGSFSKASP